MMSLCLWVPGHAGTTSKPKGVPLTHANLAASLVNIRETYELTPADRSLLVMPLFHVHGLMAGAGHHTLFSCSTTNSVYSLMYLRLCLAALITVSTWGPPAPSPCLAKRAPGAPTYLENVLCMPAGSGTRRGL